MPQQVHLMRPGARFGRCVACGAVYAAAIEAAGDAPAVAEKYPGSFFSDIQSWSLHHARCVRNFDAVALERAFVADPAQ